MSLYVASIASGSNGNCYYIGNEQEAILVDAGISCREIENRMNRMGLSRKKVRAIFISNVLSDHIRGLQVLSKKHNLPVYISTLTYQFSGMKLEQDKIFSFTAGTPIRVGTINIHAFNKLHDAADPYSFVISSRDVSVGVFTDIGLPCQQVVRFFKECHAVFLETNYDDEMLDKGNYPFHLKKRIKGEKGHLSNKQALELFLKHKPSQLSHLFFSHLSKNNNCPQLVQELFNQHAGGVTMVIASRFKETPVYHISPAHTNKKAFQFTPAGEAQLSLAFD